MQNHTRGASIKRARMKSNFLIVNPQAILTQPRPIRGGLGPLPAAAGCGGLKGASCSPELTERGPDYVHSS